MTTTTTHSFSLFLRGADVLDDDALGAPSWIALLLLAVTATAYVLVSERRTHR